VAKKMRIEIPYDKKEKIEIEFPDKNLLKLVYPNEVEVKDEFETLNTAIDNPNDSKPFDEFLSDAKDVMFIVNDQTRPTPTVKVLDIIYNRIQNKPIKFIVATGVHRGPTREELYFIFGKYYDEFKDKIYIHDSKKDEDMVYLGTSKNGTEMWVNKLGVEAHKLVPIGSVEPHYFAGYTGGRKSFLPGIASYKTIEQNHKYALRPESKALVLEGNPVHEDMIDASKTIKDKEIFSIQTVLDRERKIYAAVAGDIFSSFDAAVNKAHEVFCVKIPEKADIVITVAPYPMDIDLYQSQKAIDNGKLALNKGGILIMVSSCRMGIGPKDFFDLMASCNSPEEIIVKIGEGYKLGYHKTAKLADIATWAEMWTVSELPDEDVKSIFMTPFKSIQKAVDKALEQKGEDAKILILMEGSITVPSLTQFSS
jgi:nickel-dependent lactate racemase